MSVAVLVNVHSRHGSADVGRRIQSILPRALVTVTSSLDEARAWVGDVLVREPPDVLLSGGGDGTAVSLLNEVRSQRIAIPAFGLLPLGTGNGWARATGAQGVGSALRGLARLRDDEVPTLRQFGLVETEGRVTPFAGTGWDAEVLADYRKMMDALPEPLRESSGGTAGYFRSMFTRTIPRHLRGNDRPNVRVVNLGAPAIAIDDDGRAVPVPGGGTGAVLYEGPISVGGAATTEQIGLGFRAFRFAHSVPGRMAVRVYAASTLHATLRMPWLWRGAHPLPHDHNWMLTHCRMDFDRPVPFEIGGDLAGDRTSVELRLADEGVPLVDWRALRTRALLSRLDDLRSFTVADLRACPPGDAVRIAIVDSGVSPALLGDGPSLAVRQSGLLSAVEPCAPGDVHHHGTAVASILRDLAANARLTSVRVVDDLGRGSAAALRTALEFCVRERFDVVNLSLGTRKRELLLDVYDLVDRAAVAGVVLVCATDNVGTPDYPAACTSLIAVDRLAAEDPYTLRFRDGHRVGFLARGEDVEVAAPSGGRHRVTGASFACPHVAAFAARLLAARPGLRPFEVKTALHAAAATMPASS